MARGQQLGRYRGWLQYDGKRIEVDETTWLGQRDHSWGVRAEMRTDESHPPLTYYPPFFYCWTTAQFKGRGLHLFFKERAPGDKIYLSGEEVFDLGEKVSGRNQLADLDHEIDRHRRSAWPVDGRGEIPSDLRRRPPRARRAGARRCPADQVLPQRRPLRRPRRLVPRRRPRQAAPRPRDLGPGRPGHAQARPHPRRPGDRGAPDGDEVGYGIVEYGVGKGYAKYESVQAHPPI